MNYYEDGRKFKPKDVIRDWELNFNLGSAVKYIARLGRKTEDGRQDLAKAVDYLMFELDAQNELAGDDPIVPNTVLNASFYIGGDWFEGKSD